jgi:[ribosomal protein S5]-alanine N-acetyltransferase
VNLEFKQLSEVERLHFIALHTNPVVRRHMPLSSEKFGDTECAAWIADKKRLWEEYGYGLWAFIIDGEFAGWGGLQPENGEVDVGLVLHPDYWGTGKAIYDEIIRRAFEEMGLESVTVLLPPTRTRVKAIFRLVFKLDGELAIAGERFIRYRLHRSAH